MPIERKRQQGVILFVAVMLLALMSALGIAALDTATRDRQAAGFQNRSSRALFAADAAVAAARSVVAANATDCSATPAFPGQNNSVVVGDVQTYAKYAGQPKYYGDPAVANPIVCKGVRGVSGSGNLRIGAQAVTQVSLWQINVVGESPDGSRVRLEVMAEQPILK